MSEMDMQVDSDRDMLDRIARFTSAAVERFEVTNPATGAFVASVPDMGASETDDAIAAAGRALPGWAALTAKERAAALRRWHDLILSNADALATLLTREQGKPLAEARGEITFGASFVEWFAEEAKRTYGDIIPTNAASRRLMVLRQPVGVVAAITPWNFPNAMITRKVAPALAAGCTVVVKPAEDTPLSALALAVLAEEAGIPAGVFGVITAQRPEAVAARLTASSLVRKFSFTGSTAVGKILMRQCAETVKKISLELGGNAPFIVFEDADIEAAVAGALMSKYRNAGQTCVCANRIMVHAEIMDEFAARYAEAVADLQLGDGMDPTTGIGPLINAKAVEKVAGLVDSAVAEGARVHLGAGRPNRAGHFYEPTILSRITPEMEIARSEIFGPVAPLIGFESEAEAIELANDTPYGLAAYFWTRDLARSWRVAERLEYGMVGVNEGMMSSEAAPFGGVKESGLGREGSRYGIEEFLEMKYVAVGGLS